MSLLLHNRLIRLPEVVLRTGLGKSSIYAKISENNFPKPVKIGRTAAWVEHEIDTWVNNQIAARGKIAA